MTFRLRTSHPKHEPRLLELVDAAFERTGHESRLLEALAAGSPDFDPGLCLVAGEDEEHPAGFALFLPRAFRLRGTWVPMAVAAPIGSLPAARGRGLGRFLLEVGFTALVDRGLRGAVVLGPREYFERHGFAPAFNLYCVRVRREDLEPGDTDGWRGLGAEDLTGVQALYERTYGALDGSERRSASAIDFECATPQAHTLVLGPPGRPRAYLRFRIREAIELRECAAEGPAEVAAVLAFLRRLADEHGRAQLQAHLAPGHPVARALFLRGCLLEASDFGGAAMLAVLDWPGLLADLGPGLARALGDGESLSLELGGNSWRLEGRAGALEVTRGRVAGAHLAPPPGLAPALFTGQRSASDLAWDDSTRKASDMTDEAWERARRLFPGGSPSWTYAPIFEVADD